MSIAISKEREFVADIARNVWTPHDEISVSEWAEKHVVLDKLSSSRPGPWSNELTPYLVGIMDSIIDPNIDEIVIIKMSQAGGTELLKILLGYIIAMCPAPTALWYPNEIMARSAVQDRIKPMIRASPVLSAELQGEDLEDMSSLCLRFSQMRLYVAGAGSVNNLRSRPIKFVLIDEADLVGREAVEEGRQRCKTFPGSKLVIVGTPGMADQGIDAEYASSDRRFYAVPCPHCLGYQNIVWERLRWNGGVNADVDQVEVGTWVECAVCRQRIEHSDKAWMGACGRWVAEGQGITSRELGSGEHADSEHVSPSGVRFVPVVSAGRISRKVGFQIPMGVIPFTTWGKIARGYVAAKGNPPPVWWNGQIGRAWRLKGDRSEADDLKKLVRPIPDGGHEFGRVPSNAVFLCAAIDVQRDRVWYQVDAFGPEMEWSALVDCGYLPSAEGDKLYVVDKLIGRSWMVQGDNTTALRCLYWGIDSGDGRRTGDVYDAVKRSRKLATEAARVPGSQPLPKLYAIKGDGYSTSPKPWRCSELTEQGVSLLLVKSAYYKDIITASHAPVDREKLTDGKEHGGIGAEMSGLAGRRILPVGTIPEYYEHYTSEERVVLNAKVIWRFRTGKTQNHLFDCGKYLFCLAEYLDGRAVGEAARADMWARMSVVRPASAEDKKSPLHRRGGQSQGLSFAASASEMRRGVR